jgi:dTDP-3-amino-3,4,6-trideoxy-alpha-D-glucose transaminase
MTRRVVPLDDLEGLYAEQADEIRSAAEKVLASGRYTFTKGKEVESFERAFAEYIGTGDCVGVSSGTAALWLALEALGIGPGDEVIVPANTYVASVFAISYRGATPVLADVDEATFTLDPAVVETLITPRTAALLPVHLFGTPCDMDALSRIAASAGLAIVEDAAQAHGATLHGKRVGTFGAAGCFSFYPTKNLGAMGDAGALTTDDPAVAASVRRQRYMGQEHKYNHLTIGYQERLDEIQAAVLATRLPRLDAWNAQRRHQAHLYNELLSGTPVVAQAEPDGSECVYYVYTVRTPRRDELAEYLAARGVETGLFYPKAIYEQPAYEGKWQAGDYPVTQRLQPEILSLPVFPGYSDDDIAYVAGTVRQFFTAS